MVVFQLIVLLLIKGCLLVSPRSLEQIWEQSHHDVTVEKTELLERLERNTDNIATFLNVSFTILHVSGACPGGSTAGLGDTTLRLEFRNNASNFQWVEAASGIPTDVGLYSITVSAGCGVCVEFRLVQEEHGGGECNCWNISGNVTVDESAATPWKIEALPTSPPTVA